jgi:hypothetical protein
VYELVMRISLPLRRFPSAGNNNAWPVPGADATAGSITGAVVVGRVRPWWSPTGRRSTPAASGTETARRTVVTRRAVVERMAMVCGGRPDVASLAGVGRPGHDPGRTSNGEGPSGLAWAELTVTTEELRWRWPHH